MASMKYNKDLGYYTIELTEKEQEEEYLKKQYKELKLKGKPTKIAEIMERLEVLEKMHNL